MRFLPPFYMIFPVDLLCETSLALWKKFHNRRCGVKFHKTAVAVLNYFWQFTLSVSCADLRYAFYTAKYYKIKGYTTKATTLCYTLINENSQEVYEVAMARLLLVSITRTLDDAATILVDAERTFYLLKCSKEVQKCHKLVAKLSIEALEKNEEPIWKLFCPFVLLASVALLVLCHCVCHCVL